MECPVCGESFLNTWLECVRFVDSKKVERNLSGRVIVLRGSIKLKV